MKRPRPTRGYTAEATPRRDGAAAFRRGSRLVLSMLLAGCSGPAGGGSPGVQLVATPLAAAPPVAPDPLTGDTAPALDAVLIDRVPEGTFGPYLGTSQEGRAVAVWAALAQGSGRRWFSVILDAKGAPLAPPRSLADAPNDLALATVTGTADGFVALAAGVTPAGTRLEALRLGPTGELVNGPSPLVHSRTEVLWVKALPVGTGGVALWASLAVSSADIFLARLSARGAQQAEPVRVLEGAKAWQAVEFSDGIALVAVVAGPTESSRALRVAFLDTEGRTLARTEVRSGTSLEDQVDATRIGDNLVLSWTERDGVDARLYLAAIGPDTRLLVPPQAAGPPFGRQRLIELIPAADRRGGALLAWESVGQAPLGEQRVQLARVSDRARLEPGGATLTFAGEEGERPEFARKGLGLAGLTRAAACVRGAQPCVDPDPVPTFVELGPELEVLASEPVRLASDSGRVVDLAWGLHCSAEACAALGALPATPVPIYGIELRARSDKWPAVASQKQDTLPSALALRAVAGDTAPLADVVSAAVGSSWLVATLTQFDDDTPYVRRTTPAPDGRLAPLRALLSVQPWGADASAQSVKIVSYRARARSGLAFTSVSSDRALLAWSALDRQRPEVFATLVGRNGESLAQRVLSSGAGEVTAVAAAPVPQGYVVAWIGDRDGEPRAFAARVNSDLNHAAPEQQLTRAPGAITALALLARGGQAWLAYVRRGDQEEQLSMLRLDAATAARKGEEITIQRSEGTSIGSPTLVAKGDGALLAWVERPLVGGESARAWAVELDAEAGRLREPIAIESEVGDPIAVRLFCDGSRCQGALDCRPPNGHALEGFSWDAGGPAPSSRVLVRRATAVADATAFTLTNNAILYADRIERRGLLRRLDVAWR